MDVARVDAIVRSLIVSSPRRGVLRGLVFAALGVTAAGPSPRADARRRRKKNGQKNEKQPLQFNAFGCLDVGQTCRGKGEICCSGICEGKNPKRGKRDKSQCVAHNTGDCSPLQDLCTTDPNTRCGATGICARTTGNAGFCLEQGQGDLLCTACKNDADCTTGLGPGAACIVCEVACPETRTLCAPPAA